VYADLTRSLIPASTLEGVAAQGRRVLDSNKRLVQWQLDQARSFEKQAASLWSLSLDSLRSNSDAALGAWGDALDALAPSDTTTDKAA